MRRLHAFTFFFFAALIAAAPAFGQFVSQGASSSGATPDSSELAIAYDDKHDVYLHIWATSAAVFGRFVKSDGSFAGTEFQVLAPSAGVCGPHAAYSINSPDDVFFVACGTGRFLQFTGTGSTGATFVTGELAIATRGVDVVFNTASRRFAAVFSCPGVHICVQHYTAAGTAIGSASTVSDFEGTGSGRSVHSPRVAYDAQHDRYLVAYRGNSTQDPLPNSPEFAYARIIDGTGVPLSAGQPFYNCGTRGCAGGVRWADVAYLPGSGQFAIGYSFNDVGFPFRSVNANYRLMSIDGSLGAPIKVLNGFNMIGALDFSGSAQRLLVAATATPTPASSASTFPVTASTLDGSGQLVRSDLTLSADVTGSGIAVRAGRGGQLAVAYVRNATAVLERFTFSDRWGHIDRPSAGGSYARPFDVMGWAVDRGAPTGTGMDAVHFWAFPVGGGAASFVGAATSFVPRDDVGAVFGSRFTGSGFSLTGAVPPPGDYTLVAYAHSTLTDQFAYLDSVPITITPPVPDPRMSLDGPLNNATISQPFLAGGWAVDLGATTGTGIDAVHVWAFPVVNGVVGAGQFVAQGTTAGSRLDVGAVFGSQFNNSGYTFTIGTLAPGTYILGVYARSTVSGTFNQAKFVTVTVQ